jgi:hypothetical protein
MDDGFNQQASTSKADRPLLIRKWAITINCDLLEDSRLKDNTFLVRGQDLSSKTNKRNVKIRTTIWIGALEPMDSEKTHPYNHRHCCVENTGGGISKMNALSQLTKYLNLPHGSLTCGEGQVVPYVQPVHEWDAYQKYMFKTIEDDKKPDERIIQDSVRYLRKQLQRNPTEAQVQEYLIKNDLMSFKRCATSSITQQIKLAINIADIYHSSDEEKDKDSNEDGRRYWSKLVQLNDVTPEKNNNSSEFFSQVLDVMVSQYIKGRLRNTTKPLPLRAILDIITLLLMPMFLKRNAEDHETKSVILCGRSKTGKSYFSMKLHKANILKEMTQESGCGRFDASTTVNGYLWDEADNDILVTKSYSSILKNLTNGDSAPVKIHGTSTTVTGWVVITSQKMLLKKPEDEEAWARRLFEFDLNTCPQIPNYIKSFDIMKKKNVEELLTFVYFMICVYPYEVGQFRYGNKNLIAVEYYEDIMNAQFETVSDKEQLLSQLKNKIDCLVTIYP